MMVLLRGNYLEDGTDADEDSAQDRAQLRLQVEAGHLAQQRVVARHVRRKLEHSARCRHTLPLIYINK